MISKKIFLFLAGVVLLNGALFAGEKEETKLKKIITQLCQTKPFESKIFKNTVIEQLLIISASPESFAGSLIFLYSEDFTTIKEIIDHAITKSLSTAPKDLSEEELAKITEQAIKKTAHLFLDILKSKEQSQIEHNNTAYVGPFFVYCPVKNSRCFVIDYKEFFRCTACGEIGGLYKLLETHTKSSKI